MKKATNARDRLYIAYGSNLNLEQMARRCPTAKVVGKTELRNWQLLFRGCHGSAVATVERRRSSNVPVLVWGIQPDDERALDIYEGWPRLYRKATVRIRLEGKWVSAMIYLMNDGYPLNRPGECYYNVIRAGYQSTGFDTAVLQAAVLRLETKGE
jgi:hypothetical protein